MPGYVIVDASDFKLTIGYSSPEGVDFRGAAEAPGATFRSRTEAEEMAQGLPVIEFGSGAFEMLKLLAQLAA